ncbi:MAG: exodeoxyribonuclease VII small subunit [Bacteroidetes bacterium CG2_30_33_31]|nr:MAG: exodeoxyribonuclease VII small subunit [Bacteroidetes bacterium CG2_30_33_31]
MSKERSYEEAIKELEEIVENIEEGEIGIDELASKIKKASTLLKFCKDKLRNTEQDVEEILKELGK